MIRVAVLGSTGSVGRQALDVIRGAPDQFEVAALAGGGNVALLREQLHEFRPAAVSALPGPEADALRAESDAEWSDLTSIATRDDVDVVLAATNGLAGLEPTIAALRAGTPVAIANKEALVVGGPAVLAALEAVVQEGVTESELDKARNIMLADFWRGMATIDGKASALGDFEVFHGSYERLFDRSDAVDAMTVEDLQAAAADVFRIDNATIGVLRSPPETGE